MSFSRFDGHAQIEVGSVKAFHVSTHEQEQPNIETLSSALYHGHSFSEKKLFEDKEDKVAKEPFFKGIQKVSHFFLTKFNEVKEILTSRFSHEEEHFGTNYASYLASGQRRTITEKELGLFEKIIGQPEPAILVDQPSKNAKVKSFSLPVIHQQQAAHFDQKTKSINRNVKAYNFSDSFRTHLQEAKGGLAKLPRQIKDKVKQSYADLKEKINGYNDKEESFLKAKLSEFHQKTVEHLKTAKQVISDLPTSIRLSVLEKKETFRDKAKSKIIETRADLYFYQVVAEGKLEEAKGKLDQARENIQSGIQTLKDGFNEVKTTLYYQSVKTQGNIEAFSQELSQTIDGGFEQAKTKLDEAKASLGLKLEGAQEGIRSNFQEVVNRISEIADSTITIIRDSIIRPSSQVEPTESAELFTPFTAEDIFSNEIPNSLTTEKLYEALIDPKQSRLRQIFIKSFPWIITDTDLKPLFEQLKNGLKAEPDPTKENAEQALLNQKQVILTFAKTLLAEGNVKDRQALQEIIRLGKEQGIDKSKTENLQDLDKPLQEVETDKFSKKQQLAKGLRELRNETDDNRVKDFKTLTQEAYGFTIKGSTETFSSAIDLLVSGKKKTEEDQIIKDLATDLTTFYSIIFKQIRPQEFYRKAWEKNIEESPTTQLFIQTQNQLTYYLVDRLIDAKLDPRQVAKLYTNFARIAQKLIEQRNYAAAYAIYNALNLSTVTNYFSKRDIKIPEKASKILKGLSEIFDASHNQINLRTLLKQHRQHQESTVPLLVLDFTDFTFQDENASFVNDNTEVNLSKLKLLSDHHRQIEKAQRLVNPPSTELKFDLISGIVANKEISSDDKDLYNKYVETKRILSLK
jgi:hypothetical protein